MVGVREDCLTIFGRDLLGHHGFDGSLCADNNKSGRFNVAVRRMNNACSCEIIAVETRGNSEIKGCGHYS